MSYHLDIVDRHDSNDEVLPWCLATEPLPGCERRVADVFLAILRERHPDKTWTLVDKGSR